MTNFKTYLSISICILLLACGDTSNTPKSSSDNDNQPSNPLISSTTILSNIVTIIKDSLDDYADIIEQDISEPALMQNFQHPLSISLHVENDTLYLIYSCTKMLKQVTDMRTEQYPIPIKSSANNLNTQFRSSLEKKQLIFIYNGLVYVRNEPLKADGIQIKITTKLSDETFKKVVEQFNTIGFVKQ